MNTSLKISVLTPCFNAGKYLQRAINSVTRQSYTNWEHVVMDGGSTDDTIDILKANPHIIWQSAKDKGQADAMNKAFDKSTGHLIIYLNADDEFCPGWFEEVIQHFTRVPATDLLVGNILLKYPDSSELQDPAHNFSDIINPLHFRFPYNPVGYVYRRHVQAATGPFPISNHYTMDYWFLLRAFRVANVQKTPVVAGIFYYDGNNKTSDKERAIKSLKQVQRAFLQKFFWDRRVTTHLLKSFNGYVASRLKRIPGVSK